MLTYILHSHSGQRFILFNYVNREVHSSSIHINKYIFANNICRNHHDAKKMLVSDNVM